MGGESDTQRKRKLGDSFVIYWLKKIEWRIRKALGLTKRKVRTLDDSLTFDQELLMKLIIGFFLIIIFREVCELLVRGWFWFFPRVIRAPVEYL